MIGDPNWLYSTIAQSSAAIVAIVGGFITATVLMLMAEKRSLTNQRTDKESRLSALKFEEKEAFETYETMKVDQFFDAITNDLKNEDELPPLEVLMQRYPKWNLDHEILKREYEKLSKQRLEARHFIEQHSDKIDPTKFVLFEEWVKENELDISSYDDELLEEEYYRFRTREEKILEEEKRKVEEERRKAAPPYLQGILELQERFRAPILNFITPLSPQLTQHKLYGLTKEDRRLEDAERRLSTLRHEIFLLETEVAHLDSRLSTFSYPPNLRWGVAVLGYLAVFSIFLPVLLIYNQLYTNIARIVAMAAFYIGIIALFTYVVFLITTLRRPPNAAG